jgi:plastocyanin
MASGLRLLPAVLVSVTLAACGGGGGTDSASRADSPTAAPQAPVAPAGTASVSGTVSFVGTPPVMPVIRQDRDCAALHDGPVHAETVVVNDNGTLRHVFIHVKEGLGDHEFPVPAEPVVLDQEGCVYVPHVFGIQTGQTLNIINSDPFQHNVHGMGERNRSFNVSMPKQGDERERTFPVTEVMMLIKCDVHGWMNAYAGVVDHPYFAVTGDDGTFRIDGLPAGTYVIEAWQQEYGASEQTVTVSDGGSVTVDFSFGEAAAG